MAPVRKKILNYTDENMQNAIRSFRNGQFKSKKACARAHGVPASTLISKLNGKAPETRKMGPDPFLTAREENLLCDYIFANAKKGIPIKARTLTDTVKKILDDDNRKTAFKNNCPGKKWIKLFKGRHPEVKARNAEAISKSRAAVTELDLKKWFDSLREYLESKGATEILDCPDRIFNADESGFQLCPDSGTVLGPVGMKNFYEIKTGNEKEQLTFMLTISADGKIICPMVLYPLKRISRDIAINMPENFCIGKSPSGWMTGPVYYEYIANCFDQWLTKHNIRRPVLLLIDGHRSHLTLQVSQFCEEKQILAFALYPNSTHILQPADVTAFKCLKSGWKNYVYDYKRRTGHRHLTRASFAPILSQVLEEKLTPEIIKNGFRSCGIYPFNPSAVDYTKCMSHEVRSVIPTITKSIDIETVLYIESLMRRGRPEMFRAAEKSDWDGDESAKELFYVWKKLRQIIFSGSTLSADAFISDDDAIRFSEDRGTNISPVSNDSTSVIITDNITHTFIPCTPDRAIPISVESLEEPIPFAPDRANPILLESLEEHVPSTPDRTFPISVESMQEPIPTTPNHVIPSSVESLEDSIPSAPDCAIPISVVSYEEPDLLLTTTPSTSKSISLIKKKQQEISPAFANHIIWPSDSPIKTGRKKELFPNATFEDNPWKKYWIDKDNIQQQKEEKTKDRKKKREEKKRYPAKKKRRVIISSESETEELDKENSDRTDNIVEDIGVKKLANVIDKSEQPYPDQEITEGLFVSADFPTGKRIYKYLCVVQKVFPDGDLEVMAMKACNKENTIFVSDEKDLSTIKRDQVKEIHRTPVIRLQGIRIQYVFSKSIDIGAYNLH